MRVHHLNCGTLSPVGGPLSGSRRWFGAAWMVCHCLLVELSDGLLLVDTGFGLREIADPNGRLGREFVEFGRPKLVEAETAIRQVQRLGYRPEDVKHIVPTHLDLDHASAVADFPWAEVHVLRAEHAVANAPSSFTERRRYRPVLWEHGVRWSLHDPGTEEFCGIPGAFAPAGFPPEVRIVPLPGHSRGHCGVAVKLDGAEGATGGTGAAGGAGRWLLHAGDAYVFRDEMDPVRQRCPLGFRIFQRWIQADGRARITSQAALRRVANDAAAGVFVMNAHDTRYYTELTGLAIPGAPPPRAAPTAPTPPSPPAPPAPPAASAPPGGR
ncbi:MAG: MBL fold metallo-hydrolase [Planctomycetes bacterium]|nr:MBL fold metallo-hydrolase [Planctomycetota bacterium]